MAGLSLCFGFGRFGILISGYWVIAMIDATIAIIPRITGPGSCVGHRKFQKIDSRNIRKRGFSRRRFARLACGL